MHQQEIVGICFLALNLTDSCRHGHSADTGGTDQRIDLVLGKQIHQLCHQYSGCCRQNERNDSKAENAKRLGSQKISAVHRNADADSEKDCNDIDDFVLSRLAEPLSDSALAYEIAQKQHRYQRRSRWNHYNTSHHNAHGKHQFFQPAYRAQTFHANPAFFLSRQRPHDRRLYHRNQRHITVCRYCNRANEMRRQPVGQKDRGRAVCSADNTDRSTFGQAVFNANRFHQKSCNKDAKHTKLGGGSEQKSTRVRNQRPKIGQSPNTEKDNRRKKFQMNSLKEIVKQSTGTIFFEFVDLSGKLQALHNSLSGKICQQSAKGDRHQQQWLEFFVYRKIEKYKSNHPHDQHLPVNMGNPGIFVEILK